jgi:pyruvate dehydrogenase E1 component alpha subunit
VTDRALPVDLRLELHRWMQLTRAFDEAMVRLWKQGGGVGGTFSQRGHEATSVGAATALVPGDVVAPMHRDLGAYLVRGITPGRIWGNLLGRATGVSGGRDANLHGMGDPALGIVGFISHLPHSMPVALGYAVAFRHRGEPQVALTYTGDGASSTGLFHETLNMAAVFEAPLVVVVENNRYAYSTPLEQQMRIADIADRAAGFGLPGVVVDGNDVEAVHAAASEAIDRARSGGGPTLIEAKTMRMLGHAMHDGAEYVPRELLREWEARDPIATHEARLLADGVASRDELDTIEKEVRREVEDALAAAQAAPMPDPATVERGVYAEEAP